MTAELPKSQRRVKNHSFLANCEKKLLWIQKNFFEKITESFKSHPQNIRYIYRSLSQFFFCHIADDAVSSSQVQTRLVSFQFAGYLYQGTQVK